MARPAKWVVRDASLSLAFHFISGVEPMQTDYEKAIRKRAAVKTAVGIALILVVHLSGLLAAVESYFDKRDHGAAWIRFEHLAALGLFLLPWLCFFVGVLEFVMGIPFRAIAWDWDHSRRGGMGLIALGIVLGLIGLLFLVLRYVYHVGGS